MSQLASFILVSVIYEPLRTFYLEDQFDEEVGGVGGVGGLCNMWNPYEDCETTPGGEDAPYCFHKGFFLGFTPFALIMLLLWTLPFALTLLIQASMRQYQSQNMKNDDDGNHGLLFQVLQALWFILSAFWLLFPLWQYETSEFFEKDIWHHLIALSIAAAYPLSWHLSYVAFLSIGSYFLSSLQDNSRDFFIRIHKFIGWNTVFWASVHGGGQIIWFISQNIFLETFDLRQGENLIYVTGAMNLILILILAILSWNRHSPTIQPIFLKLHKPIAILLMTCASAHWWPFALFLLPTVAIYAAVSFYNANKNEFISAKAYTKAYSISIFGSLVGLSIIWFIRNIFMGRHNADLFAAFIFPPLALLSSFIFSRITLWICIIPDRSDNGLLNEHI